MYAVLLPPSARITYLFVSRLLGTDLLLGQRGEAQVGLDDPELGEQGLGLLVADGGRDDDVVAGDPVDGGGDAVLVAGLEGVDDAEDLGGVAAGRGRVAEDGADLLVGVDEEDGADGEGNALGVDVGGVLVVDPGGVSVVCEVMVRCLCLGLTCRRGGRPGAACHQ